MKRNNWLFASALGASGSRWRKCQLALGLNVVSYIHSLNSAPRCSVRAGFVDRGVESKIVWKVFGEKGEVRL